MSIIIDTGIFYAFYNRKDKYHKKAKIIISKILDGDYGQPILIDYVFDELVSLVQYRSKENKFATKIGYELLQSNIFYFTQVTNNAFRIAWKIFANQQGNKYLSFTDAIILSMSTELNISYIASFDSLLRSFSNVSIIDY